MYHEKIPFPSCNDFCSLLRPKYLCSTNPWACRQAGPQLSGFFDFSSFPADFPSGVGTIQRITCTVGSSAQPAIYGGNMLLDCDAETPHNETTIAVDPNDRNHAIGGYHS